MRLYDHPRSGNCYKVRLLLAQLGIPYERVEVDILDRSRRREILGGKTAHLSTDPFFVGGRYTIADIALYAYTHVAEEGGVSLAPAPGVRAWIGRIEAQPGRVATEG